jgi:hypothetical protein
MTTVRLCRVMSLGRFPGVPTVTLERVVLTRDEAHVTACALIHLHGRTWIEEVDAPAHSPKVTVLLDVRDPRCLP